MNRACKETSSLRVGAASAPTRSLQKAIPGDCEMMGVILVLRLWKKRRLQSRALKGGVLTQQDPSVEGKAQEPRVQVAACAEGCAPGLRTKGTGDGRPALRTRATQVGEGRDLAVILEPPYSTKTIAFWTRTLNLNTCRPQGAVL